MQQKSMLEQQATQLTMDYVTKKAEMDLLQKQYEIEKEHYEWHLQLYNKQQQTTRLQQLGPLAGAPAAEPYAAQAVFSPYPGAPAAAPVAAAPPPPSPTPRRRSSPPTLALRR